MKIKRALFFSILAFFCCIVSCKKSTTPTSPTFRVQVSMQVVPYYDAPVNIDTTLCYGQEFVDWTQSGLLDTTKADSVAQWFTQSPYPITDMWFPDVGNVCGRPILTENIVTLELARQDSVIRSEGYRPTTALATPCFQYYRHYVFTTIKNGT
jgi:hypothetical protein